MDPVPDPLLPEKILGYSRESNPGPLGWQTVGAMILSFEKTRKTGELYR